MESGDIAQEHGYQFIVYNTHEECDREKEIVNLLLNGKS